MVQVVLQEENFPNLEEFKTEPEQEFITFNNIEGAYYKGVRQQHFNFKASVDVETCNEKVGLCIFQNQDVNYKLLLSKNKIEIYFGYEILSEIQYDESKPNLKITCDNQFLSFYVDENLILENVDMNPLSTEIAGGFVGNTIGMYKTGEPIFDCFENFKYNSL